MTLAEQKRLYKKAKTAYYNSNETLLSDAEFDKLENAIRQQDPDWAELKKTGVRAGKNEVPLLHPAPSLNKIYPEGLSRFYGKYLQIRRWIIMDKLDGTSLQLVYKKGIPVKLITRGDGITGRDVSHFIPFLVKAGKLPSISATARDSAIIVFRLEALIPQSIFNKKYSKETLGDKGMENGRNMVNGLFNQKKADPALSDVSLVVLGVYDKNIEEGLLFAKQSGFETVKYHTIIQNSIVAKQEDLLISNHKNMLQDRRKESCYEMDGLVLTPAQFMMEFKNADKPKQMIAFKVNEDANAIAVTVKEVKWQKTRQLRWQPKIIIEPTHMDGVTVTNVTAHNPAWMKERGIGPGAIVKVLRSGGVIPKIVHVVKKAKFQNPPGEFSIEGRYFLMLNEDRTTRIRSIHHFMATLGIELLAEKTLSRLYDVNMKSIHDYLNLFEKSRCTTAKNKKEPAFLQTAKNAGLGTKQTFNIWEELKRVLMNPISLKKFMVACGCFDGGIGERKLTQLEDAGFTMKQLLSTYNLEETRNSILKVKGFNEKTEKKLFKGLERFTNAFGKLVQSNSFDFVNTAKKKQGLLNGIHVSWTGYRNEDQEAIVETNGGNVVPFSSKTTVLLYHKDGKKSDKIEKAGNRAKTWNEFLQIFKLD